MRESEEYSIETTTKVWEKNGEEQKEKKENMNKLWTD